MQPPVVAVTVVTGFLGAGKTTLLNRWLAEIPRGQAAVIVNEFGTVGIDGELLAGRVRELVELTGGCICCTTQADLLRALADLATGASPPARVFIETSGAASPAGVLRAILRNPAAESMRLDGIVTAVDATRITLLADNELALEQVSYADLLVLTRGDTCTPEALANAQATLGQRNATAVVAASARGEWIAPSNATLEGLLAQRSLDFATPKFITPSRAPGHVPGLESVSLTLPGEVDEEAFGEWVESQLARFEGRLLRIKGILAVHGLDERMVLQGVADQVEVSFGAPWGEQARNSRVVLVGFGLDRAELEASFADCAATR